jgi:hypothetical protein
MRVQGEFSLGRLIGEFPRVSRLFEKGFMRNPSIYYTSILAYHNL